jgi:CheY-like chemotaxis protein
MNPHLRLVSREGAEYVERFIFRGDSYGAGGRCVNGDHRTLVEFARPRLGGDHFLVALPADELAEELAEVWSRVEVEKLALPALQADRLRRWIASPFSVEDAVVMLVGYDEVIEKARLALARLQLEPRLEPNGLSAVDRIRRLPPQLVVVGREVRVLEPLEVVRRVHTANESRAVPIVVLGGDEAAARDAGAVLHMSLPLDYRALVADAAQLLELL